MLRIQIHRKFKGIWRLINFQEKGGQYNTVTQSVDSFVLGLEGNNEMKSLLKVIARCYIVLQFLVRPFNSRI